MTIDELMTNFLNQDYDYIVDVAKQSLPSVLTTLDRFTKNDKECFAMFLNVIGSMISVDGVIQQKEKDLYCDLFNSYISYDDFFDMMKGRNDYQLRDSVDSFVDMLESKVSSSVKYDFLVVILAFAVIDEKLTGEEKQYFRKLFN